MKKLLFAAIAGLMIVAATWLLLSQNQVTDTERTDTTQPATQQPTESEETFDQDAYSLSEPGSIWLIVNKDRPIPSDYVPENLRDVNVARFPGKPLSELQLRDIAASALERMFDAARQDDIELMLGSGYRSYEVQAFYYNNYVATYGQEEADRFSAKPGTSEHQTGLAADVSGIDRTCYLEICFENEPAGRWVADNAYQYGFIIRYPEGKEAITGYQYEPWHLRYVGADLAAQLHDTSLTMEEFFGL